MIPLSRVVTEIERHVSIAKSKLDDQSIRDSLLAIRALCDVALSEQPDVKPVSIPIQIAQTTPAVQTVTAGERMKEADANGDSLFDF